MLNDREVLSTLSMIKNENLDVRTVTLGVSLLDCASHDLSRFTAAIHERITTLGRDLVAVCDEVGERFGIPVVNKRISVSPIAVAAAPFDSRGMVEVARTLDQAARDVRVDFIGGFGALVEKGMAKGDLALIEAIPKALCVTTQIGRASCRERV